MTGKCFSRRPFLVAVALLFHQKDTAEQGFSCELGASKDALKALKVCKKVLLKINNIKKITEKQMCRNFLKLKLQAALL